MRRPYYVKHYGMLKVSICVVKTGGEPPVASIVNAPEVGLLAIVISKSALPFEKLGLVGKTDKRPPSPVYSIVIELTSEFLFVALEPDR